MDTTPNCFDSFQNENYEYVYRNLNIVQLSLIERYWICLQVQNDILSIDEINNRYQIDIDRINIWLMNLIPSNDGGTIEKPIDSIGLDILQLEYDKELSSYDNADTTDEERILKILREQLEYTQDRLSLYNLLQSNNVVTI
jgi:hypothetical protein